MGVLDLDPFGFRLADLLVVFVGHRSGLVLYHVTDVNLVAENGFDRHVVPERCLAPKIFPSLRHVVKAPWRGDLFRVELQGDLAKTVALQAQVKDVPHHGSSHRVNLKNVLVRFAFLITEGRIAADILTALECGQLDCLDLAAGVPRIEVIHHIFQNNQHLIVLAECVNPVIQSDETAAEGWEHKVCIKADLKIVSAKTAHILDDDRADFSGFGFCKHCLKSGTVEVTPCVTVIGKMLDIFHTAFVGKIFEKALLIQYRVRFALLLIILGQPFIEGCNSIKIPDFRHFLASFPSFIRSRI